MNYAEEIRNILEEVGFKPVNGGNGWLRMRALHRPSDSNTLAVNTLTGVWTDHVTGQNGALIDLVMISKNLDEAQARQFLVGSYYGTGTTKTEEKEKLKVEQKLSKEFIKDLLPSYNFYKNRGISEETIKLFGGGVKSYGKMNNRFVFPIWNNGELIGIAGRCLYSNSVRPKWKLIGKKGNWVYPLEQSQPEIEKQRQVILVESLGDMLALYEAGIKNVLVLFGLSVSKAITLSLITLNIEKVIIALNNDVENTENRGLIAAEWAKKKLEKYFNPDCIQIRMPPKKDFGECSRNEILEWHKTI